MRVLPLNDLCEGPIAIDARERMCNTMKRTFRPHLSLSHSLHGVRDAGVSRGGGLPIVRDLQRQLKEVHATTVAAMRARRPQWTEALLQRKRLKKAKGRPLDSIPTQERERLEVTKAHALVYCST